MEYIETFDDGPGGWFGWISNAAGMKALEIRDSSAISRSPWWIDYNHAPPGAGYLHLLYMLNTRGKAGEHQREVHGENRFIQGGYSTDFTNARVTLRLKGELESKGAQLVLLVQAVQGGICSGWLLTGQPFRVTPDWSEQTVTAVPDPSQWVCLGSRHDRGGLLRHDTAGNGAARRQHRHSVCSASIGRSTHGPTGRGSSSAAARARLSGVALAFAGRICSCSMRCGSSSADSALFRPGRPIAQKCSFSTSSNTRGSKARVIVPKAAVPKLVLGAVRGGVLVALNASTRNSALICSLMGNILASMTSRV